MIVTFKSECRIPSESDADIWKMQEITDGRLVCEWWCARLWTGAVVEYDSRDEALAAYWNS